MQRAMTQLMEQCEAELRDLRRRLKDPRQRLEEMMQRLDELSMRSQRAVIHQIQYSRMNWERLQNALKNLNPLSILERGYAVVTPKDSLVPVTTAQAVQIGDEVEVRLADGGLSAEIRSKWGRG
jgi:exodeoxyribonuclease VII large subunit